MNRALEAQTGPGRRKLWNALGMALLGAVVGAGTVVFFEERVPGIQWADVLAVAVALICLITAAILGVASLDPRSLASTLKVEGDSTPREVTGARVQAVMLALAGVLMIAPVLPDALGVHAPGLSFALVAALFVIQSAYNWTVWKKGDEMMRRVVTEAAALSFWLLQAGFFLYAAAERLGLVAPATAWRLVTVLMAVYLLSPNVTAIWRNRA
jgi:peptidoglycan/LPS O-acetylase OafA/YrhL